MKKEYIILAIVIVALGLYLALRNVDRTSFQLPTPDKLKSASIDRVIVTKEGRTVELKKKDDKWFIQPKNYPASPSTVQNMLKAGTELTITALASESGTYDRYDLSDDKKINVQLFEDGKKKRDFDIGREAGTYQHTFVKLEGDKRVYHARGSLDRTFDRSIEDLRDKTVLTFDEPSITEIAVQKGDKQIAIARKESAGETASAEKDDTQSPVPAKKEWVDEAGSGPVDQTAVERLLGSFSRLQCESFLDDKTKADFTQPVWTLTFKNGEKTFSFFLYAAGDGEQDNLPAVSSTSDYVFTLSKSRAQSFEKHVDKLLGIKEAASGQSGS